jgi:hypothetical protein
MQVTLRIVQFLSIWAVIRVVDVAAWNGITGGSTFMTIGSLQLFIALLWLLLHDTYIETFCSFVVGSCQVTCIIVICVT